MRDEDADGNPKHIIIDQVVSNDKIHFFKVPKLGSYLAIRMEYQTCLYEESYDAAIENALRVDQMRRNQEDEKKAFFEE